MTYSYVLQTSASICPHHALRAERCDAGIGATAGAPCAAGADTEEGAGTEEEAAGSGRWQQVGRM